MVHLHLLIYQAEGTSLENRVVSKRRPLLRGPTGYAWVCCRRGRPWHLCCHRHVVFSARVGTEHLARILRNSRPLVLGGAAPGTVDTPGSASPFPCGHARSLCGIAVHNRHSWSLRRLVLRGEAPGIRGDIVRRVCHRATGHLVCVRSGRARHSCTTAFGRNRSSSFSGPFRGSIPRPGIGPCQLASG